VGKVKVCARRTSDGQVFWAGGSFESYRDVEAWEREMGRKVWCVEDREV
jgi:hypothetical protein